MSTDPVLPLSDDEYGIPCDRCDGSGTLLTGQARVKCPACSGSGYGAPDAEEEA